MGPGPGQLACWEQVRLGAQERLKETVKKKCIYNFSNFRKDQILSLSSVSISTKSQDITFRVASIKTWCALSPLGLAQTCWWAWDKPERWQPSPHILTSEDKAGKEMGHAMSSESRRTKAPFRASVIFLVLITRWTRQSVTQTQWRQTWSASLQAGTVDYSLQESWYISQKQHNWNPGGSAISPSVKCARTRGADTCAALGRLWTEQLWDFPQEKMSCVCGCHAQDNVTLLNTASRQELSEEALSRGEGSPDCSPITGGGQLWHSCSFCNPI